MITVKDVTKSFGHTEALRGVSLEVEPGGFAVVFGDNGAGKSTLLRIMAGLMAPSSGEVAVDGTPIGRADDSYRTKIGVVGHQAYLYPSLSAEANLVFFGRLFGIGDPRERAGEALREVGLWGRKEDAVATYSSGMKQRMAIARAILHRPDVLLLDEPFSGLDAGSSEHLKELLRGFKEEGRTVVMVTHRLRDGFDLARSVVILHRGRVNLNEDRSGLEWHEFDERYHRQSVQKQ